MRRKRPLRQLFAAVLIRRVGATARIRHQLCLTTSCTPRAVCILRRAAQRAVAAANSSGSASSLRFAAMLPAQHAGHCALPPPRVRLRAHPAAACSGGGRAASAPARRRRAAHALADGGPPGAALRARAARGAACAASGRAARGGANAVRGRGAKVRGCERGVCRAPEETQAALVQPGRRRPAARREQGRVSRLARVAPAAAAGAWRFLSRTPAEP